MKDELKSDLSLFILHPSSFILSLRVSVAKKLCFVQRAFILLILALTLTNHSTQLIYAVEPAATAQHSLSARDEAFLEDLERRMFRYFWEEADPKTGLVPDRARMDGSPL